MLQMHAQLMGFQVTDVAYITVNVQACFCLGFLAGYQLSLSDII